MMRRDRVQHHGVNLLQRNRTPPIPGRSQMTPSITSSQLQYTSLSPMRWNLNDSKLRSIHMTKSQQYVKYGPQSPVMYNQVSQRPLVTDNDYKRDKHKSFTSQLENLNNMIQHVSIIKHPIKQQSIIEQLHEIQQKLDQQNLKSRTLITPPQNYLKLGQSLGKGKFSVVHQVMDTRTNAMFALKIISKSTIKKYDLSEQIASEIKIQSILDHPNILKFYYFFTDQTHLYFLLEYAIDGELYKYMKSKKQQRLPEQEASQYINQVSQALAHLHSLGVIHRDIKPENILMSNRIMKLSDFGCAVYSPHSQRETFCGTLDYVSPEIANGQQYSFEVDIWAIGILAYELSTGKPPFFDSNYKDKSVTLSKIKQGQFGYPNWTSKEFRNFVGWILQQGQNERPQMNQILQHIWLNQ